MKVISMPRAVRPGDQVADLVVVDALQRHGVDLDLQPRRAAPPRCPSMTLPKSPQRVMAPNLSGSSVSSDTLTRFTPQPARASAKRRQLRAVGGQRQFVERAGARDGATGAGTAP